MKPAILTMIIVAGLISGSLKGGSPDIASATGPYVEVKKDLDITIFTRWVQVSETIKTRQVKSVFTCKADPEDVVALLSNDQAFPSWMNGTTVYSRIKTTDNLHWYSYVRYGLPWPLKDMDCILGYRIEEPGKDNVTRILVNGYPDFIKNNDGVTRIRHLQCEWIIRKTGPDTVAIEFIQFSNQPSKFPRWITDPILQKNLINSLNTFRGLVERQHLNLSNNK